MDPATWIAFAVASFALLTIPGPTVILVVSYAIGRGRGSAWATVPGVALGDLTAMSVSLAGAGAVLAASATLFTALKLAGALYLVWLGIRMWRNPPDLGRIAASRGPRDWGPRDWGRLFGEAYVVTALNPKSIVFFVAFVPQFIDPAGDFSLQVAILTATFVGLAALNTALWAMAAGTLRRAVATPARLRLMGRIGGGCLIGAGGLTALQSRL